MAVLSGALTGIFLCGCGSGQTVLCQYADTAMGTVVRQTLYAPDQETADSLSDAVMALLDQMEEQELSWRLGTSEIYAVNETAGSGEGCLLSSEITCVIDKCLDLSSKSEGAFDITIGAVTRLWDIDGWTAGTLEGAFRPPEGELLRQALEYSGYQKIRLETEASGEDGEILQARVFLPAGMRLDLGAAGKGLALDRILGCLEDNGISGAVISVGGSVLTYGEKPDHTDWKVGVIDPLDTAGYIGILSLKGQWCVSTSGDYERYAEADGIRYHHILDPATGMPADSGLHSVTILTKEGLLGDALSTACFVLGVEKGMELAQQYGAEAVFVTEDGEIVLTDGMKALFTPAGR
ncbi:MAG: FAD:protein FMN transferase [Lachnospiraceae bacterium]|nr:FAD:protein FMN transferase [Lachnospiraceae bacterium]